MRQGFLKVVATAFCFCCLLGVRDANAFNIYRVGKVIYGKSYDDFRKKWYDTEFRIRVGADRGKDFIVFEADSGLGTANVLEQNTGEIRFALTEAVEKALRWTRVAKLNKADASKEIDCFGLDSTDQCRRSGYARRENEMGFRFYSTNAGRQTYLIITLVDQNNGCDKTVIYLDQRQMRRLRRTIKEIQDSFEQVRKTERDQALFN